MLNINQPKIYWSNCWWFVVAFIVLVLDQWSKGLAVAHLTYAQPMPIASMLNFTLHHNPGAAFSFLSEAGGWQRWFFTGLAAVAAVLFSGWLLTTPSKLTILPLALVLVLGGAIGNAIDRVNLGYVIDFIDVFYQAKHFPTFNIADSAISVGAALLIFDMLFLEPKRGDKQ